MDRSKWIHRRRTQEFDNGTGMTVRTLVQQVKLTELQDFAIWRHDCHYSTADANRDFILARAEITRRSNERVSGADRSRSSSSLPPVCPAPYRLSSTSIHTDRRGLIDTGVVNLQVNADRLAALINAGRRWE